MKNTTLFASLFAVFAVVCLGNSVLAYAAQTFVPTPITATAMPVTNSTTMYVMANSADQDTCYVVVSTSPAGALMPTAYTSSVSCVKTTGPALINAPSSSNLRG